jgi:hypothetical protein
MKKVIKNKKIAAVVGMVVLAVALLASQVVASPPMGSGDSIVESKINYQGQLTDSAGNPLDGAYDMEFRFYDSGTDGSQVGSNITENDVEVTNGLFNVKLDVDQRDFNGKGLWLQMRVRPSGGIWDDWMTPRQEILPVPYALSLKPGATMSASMEASVLTAENTAIGHGIEGKADAGCGVRGQSSSGYGGCFSSSTGYGGLFSSDNDGFDLVLDGAVGRISTYPNDQNSDLVLSSNNDVTVRLDNDGGEEGVFKIKNSGGDDVCTVSEEGDLSIAADSYIFIPGYEFIKGHDTDTTRWGCWTNGAVRIWRGAAAGGKEIYIPITVPGVLYGQEVTVEELTIYYMCQNGTKNYISCTGLTKQVNASSSVLIWGDDTDRTSNTATSYTLSLTQHNVLSSDYGILGLRLWLNFVDDTNYIVIGGARLRLSHH